jgi:hypothetical protein
VTVLVTRLPDGSCLRPVLVPVLVPVLLPVLLPGVIARP